MAGGGAGLLGKFKNDRNGLIRFLVGQCSGPQVQPGPIHRALALFGPSGVGKTSLLLASVLPRLAAEGYQHVYVRALDDPLPALLAAEMTARMGRDPGEIYRELTREFGEPVYDRVEAAATPAQKAL